MAYNSERLSQIDRRTDNKETQSSPVNAGAGTHYNLEAHKCRSFQDTVTKKMGVHHVEPSLPLT